MGEAVVEEVDVHGRLERLGAGGRERPVGRRRRSGRTGARGRGAPARPRTRRPSRAFPARRRRRRSRGSCGRSRASGSTGGGRAGGARPRASGRTASFRSRPPRRFPTDTTGRAACLTREDAAPVEREAERRHRRRRRARAEGGGSSRRVSVGAPAVEEIEREPGRPLRGPSVPREEGVCRLRGPQRARPRVGEEAGERRRRLPGVPDREGRLARRLHGAADVPDRGTENDGEPGQERLEDVVPAPRPERPAEKGDVAEPVGRGELADRVEEKDVGRAGPARPSTAGRRAGPPRRPGVPPRPTSRGGAGARRRNGATPGAREARGEGEDEVELLLGDRPGDEDRPARGEGADLAPRRPARAGAGGRTSCRRRRGSGSRGTPTEAKRAASSGVRAATAERAASGAAKEAPRGAKAPGRTLGEASARDEDGQAAPPGRAEENGPELRLHEDEEARRGRVEEAPDGKGQVEGEGLESGRRGKVPEPPPEKPDAGRRRGGDEKRKRGPLGPESQDERVGELDLADRDPLDPDVGPRRPTRREEASGDQRRKAGTSPRPGGFVSTSLPGGSYDSHPRGGIIVDVAAAAARIRVSGTGR